MWRKFIIVTAIAAMAPLHALELADLARTEDFETHLSTAVALTREQKFSEAEVLYKQFEEAIEKFNHPLLLRAKVANNYGTVLHLTGRYAEAEKKYLKAALFWARSTGEKSDDRATTLCNLGEVYRMLGRYDDAERVLLESLAIREDILRSQYIRQASGLNTLGSLQLVASRGEAVTTMKVARAQGAMGEAQHSQRKLAEARSNLERSLALKRQWLGADHPDIAATLNNLASVHQDLGDSAMAERLYKESVDIRRKQVPLDRPALAGALNNLGSLCRQTNRLEEAQSYLEQGLATWEEALGPEHPSVGSALTNLGELALLQGKLSEAEPLLRRASAIFLAKLGPDHLQTAVVDDNLGVLFLKQDKAAGAEALFRKTLALREAKLGPKHSVTIITAHHLGQALYAQKRYTEAELHLANTLSGLEELKLQGTPEHALTLTELAFVQFGQQRLEAGEKNLNQAASYADKLPAAQRTDIANLYDVYAKLLRGAKRRQDAERIEAKVKSLVPSN